MRKTKKILCTALAVPTLAALTLAVCPTTNMAGTDSGILSPVFITASATQDRSYNFNKSYTLTGNNATDIVNVAKKQLGKTGSQLGYSEQWRADFATDCARLTGMSSSVVPYTYSSRGSCIYLYSKMINSCGAKVVTTPKVGDFVFFDWAGKKNVNNLHHVAIVTAVSGNKVTVIGGNQGSSSSLSSRKVSTVTYSINYSCIAKYVRPNYTSKTNTNTTTTKTTTSNNSSYFKKYTGSSSSIVTALNSIGATSTYAYRQKIAAANGISNYSGTASQNTKMLNLLKQGKLKKPTSSTTVSTVKYFKKYTGTSSSIVTALNSIGATSTYAYRQKIAAANGISNYSGTASQNTKMLNLLKQGKLIKP